jgi:predicted transcriptional regulator
MVASEQTIDKILQLLPNNPTIEALKETDALKDVPVADLRAALRTLEERGQVSAGELFGRDFPPQGGSS